MGSEVSDARNNYKNSMKFYRSFTNTDTHTETGSKNFIFRSLLIPLLNNIISNLYFSNSR